MEIGKSGIICHYLYTLCKNNIKEKKFLFGSLCFAAWTFIKIDVEMHIRQKMFKLDIFKHKILFEYLL